jgi:hypothetical protein
VIKSEPIYYGKYLSIERERSAIGSVIGNKPSEEDLWDKIKDVLSDGKYVHHIIKTESKIIKKLSKHDESKLYQIYGMSAPDMIETTYENKCYVIIYYEPKHI